jgi:hypothetical protein
MQYILTQDEINNMTPKSDVEARDMALFAAREKLLLVSGFTCIHAVDGKNEYCDGCPCSYIDNSHNYETWQLVCNLNKEYSQ